MNILFVLSMGLTALIAVLCGILYRNLIALQRQALAQREQLDRIEVGMHLLSDSNKDITSRMGLLSDSLLQREIYQNVDCRYENAIKEAKAGCDVGLLMQKYGLSSDESALVHALHGRQQADFGSDGVSSHAWSGDS